MATLKTPSSARNTLYIKTFALWTVVLFTSCGQRQAQPTLAAGEAAQRSEAAVVEQYTDFEKRLVDFGLVDIHTVDTTVLVRLRYATADNFLGRVLYKELHHAFMLPEMAAKVAKAQSLLKASDSSLTLLIYDAARPLNIQREMWNSVKGTPDVSFVANPAKGRGMHNYGAAVDITIAHTDGTPLPMGSDHDYFGPEARIDMEDSLASRGLITAEELKNRRLLRRVMRESGCVTCVSEWWHFNMIPSRRAKSELKIIDFEE